VVAVRTVCFYTKHSDLDDIWLWLVENPAVVVNSYC
jgi:hypothetical protein